MPGGNNSYTRPANKPQRAAMKRQKARNAAMKNLQKRREQNASESTGSEFLENDALLRSMIGDIQWASAEDRGNMRLGVEKAKERKANRYKMKSGGKVPKMKSGGKVRRDGCAVRGKTKGTMR